MSSDPIITLRLFFLRLNQINSVPLGFFSLKQQSRWIGRILLLTLQNGTVQTLFFLPLLGFSDRLCSVIIKYRNSKIK